MDRGKKKQSSSDLTFTKSSKFTAYNSVLVTGSPANVKIEKKNFVFSTQMMLTLQSYLWGRAQEIKISQINARWCPRVEPGCLSTISISVEYYLGDECDDLNADDTILSIRGRISEQLAVVMYPTATIIKAPQNALFIPWTVTAEADDIAQDDKSIVLGELQMWCKVELSGLQIRPKTKNPLYRANTILWSNMYYPYYVPFYIERKVRGIGAVLWRDTKNYEKFMREVGKHFDGRTISDKDILPLMQSMSQADCEEIKRLTDTCHATRGGLCTCGDTVTGFLSSILINNNGRCLNHGTEFDNIAHAVITGKIRQVASVCSIKF
ncbi:movement protein [Bacopa monnieri virus 2]|uniref:Movement protein n=1 Tax=Bacopa monnieri virus 2 TaxID=2813288 RepID=A0AAD2KQF0_9RHAB|nr:movement protein [Bacopa monnieri virus 2]DAF42451.1 TPA_asm: movement protein [Bacopa monnieri virus 2]